MKRSAQWWVEYRKGRGESLREYQRLRKRRERALLKKEKVSVHLDGRILEARKFAPAEVPHACAGSPYCLGKTEVVVRNGKEVWVCEDHK